LGTFRISYPQILWLILDVTQRVRLEKVRAQTWKKIQFTEENRLPAVFSTIKAALSRRKMTLPTRPPAPHNHGAMLSLHMRGTASVHNTVESTMSKFLFLMRLAACVVGSTLIGGATPSYAQTAAQYLPWTPSYVSWFCGARNGGNFCTLYAYGEQLSAGTEPLTAHGAYRILKGRTAGIGSILAQNIASMPCERVPPTHVQCIATDEVSLGVGVNPVVSVGTSQLNIYADQPGPLFDWDGDNRITADKEGLMLLRYLMGFNAQAVTRGVTLSPGKTSEDTYRAIKAGIDNGWFQFSVAVQPLLGTREGAALNRCLKGVRGAGLIAGLGLADESLATQRCNALTAIE
jgi:hypothetical protein